MCSFLFARTASYLSDSTLAFANRYARHRGPDGLSMLRRTDQAGMHLAYLHNLLDISGIGCTQPLHDRAADHGNVALFNGEIYNFGEFGAWACDSACLLPRYALVGEKLARELDGEFSVLIHDWAQNSVFVFCDPFLTKPLYFGRRTDSLDFGVATCASSLTAIGLDQIEMAEPNAAYRIHFGASTNVEARVAELVTFSLDQHRTDYDAWTDAFVHAVEKRARHGQQRPVVFLSSGFDSGAICLALNLAGIGYDTYSIEAGEDPQILAERIRANLAGSCGAAHRISGLERGDVGRVVEELSRDTEPFVYHHEDAPGVVSSLQSDGGALGGYVLAELARATRCLVNLSGTGADEIISDYGIGGEKVYYHSQFGGRFPEDLRSIFPWKKFYGDTQRSYLFKDEFILGRHGVEGRYPFLDKRVVQEFLSLSVHLKNRTYKAPLEHFLRKHNYPFEPMRKRGFSPFLER